MKTLLCLVVAVAVARSAAGQSPDLERQIRTSTVERIKQTYGVSFNPSKCDSLTLLDMESRLSCCARIQQSYGLTLDYRTTSLLDLTDIESRMGATTRLKSLYGLVYDYRTHSLLELTDIESRVSAARRIKQLYSVDVDWQKYTLLQLVEGESKLANAKREQYSSQNTTSTSTGTGYSSPTATYQYGTPSTDSSWTTSGSRYYDPNYRPTVGDHYVSEYYRSDGTLVHGHYQTNADGSFWNNYSSYGNVNPYTGRVGTKLPPSETSTSGGTYVHPYTRADGTIVSGHYRR